MEPQEVGEFKFSYKKPEQELYSLWVEDCAYSFDKKTAQELVTHMKEHWPDLEYGVSKEEKPEEVEKSLIKKIMRLWRIQTAYELVNRLNHIRYSYHIDDKEFMINECRKLCDAIFEALEEKKGN